MIADLTFNENNKNWEVIFNDEVVMSRKDKKNILRTYLWNKRVNELGIIDLVEAEKSTTISNDDIEVKFEKPTFSINEKFSFYETFLSMVIDGINNSIVVTGKGGLGKSYTMQKVIEKKGLEQDVDYIIIKGYSTAKGMYRSLFENNDKLIVFDDCDSVLKDKNSLNILKGALDSEEHRLITWNTESFSLNDDLPNTFEFTGQAIFISNMDRSNFDQAILTRSLNVDLSMTKDEALERMKSILPDVLTEYNTDLKQDALNFLSANKHIVKDMNIRLLLDIIKVRANAPENWENMAKYLVMN